MPLCALLLLLALPTLAGADAFEDARRAVRVDVGRADASGFSMRGGAALTTGATASSATLLRGQASVGKPCAGFDFATSFRQTFEEIPDMLEAYGQQLISSAPLLLLCYSAPSLCDVLKHVQSVINALLQAKYAQCSQIQTAMAYSGMRLRQGQLGQCLEDHANNGLPLAQAMRECANTVQGLRLPNGLQGGQVALIHDTMDAAGASQEMRTLASTLLGEVTMTAQNGAMGVSHRRTPGRVMARFEQHRAEAQTTLDGAVEELQTTGAVSASTLGALSVPGQPVPQGVLDALAGLRQQPQRYASHIQKLATNLSFTRLTWECAELEDQLNASMAMNPQHGEEQRYQIEQQLTALKRDLEQVRVKKRVIEQDLQPAYDAILQDYAQVQHVATQAGRRAPSRQVPAMPYGTQSPLGFGQ